MKNIRRIFTYITTLCVILALTFSTYAWFTTNNKLFTDSLTTRTNNENVTLEVSEKGGSEFTSVETASIIQVNQTDKEKLMPVSTYDLKNFVTNSITITNETTYEDEAKTFHLVSNEENYYHGRIYLRANSVGVSEGSYLSLYFDNSDSFVTELSENLATVARLGFILSDGTTEVSRIFRFEENINNTNYTSNTIVDGNKIQDDEVLSWNGNSVEVASNPSEYINKYIISDNAFDGSGQSTSIIDLRFNQIYQLDIYFYIEGCDPDCVSEQASYSAGDFNLAFYGILGG